MAKEIMEKQISPESKVSMRNPAGHSHKNTHVRHVGVKPFPSFMAMGENRFKNNATE